MAKKKRTPTEPPVIETSSVTKAYGDLVALEPTDLSIERGSLTALIGHNGSGKSTLLKMVAGLLEPTDGSIEVWGHEAGSIEARREVSYIGDDPVLYDDLSVQEHIDYLLPLHGVEDWEVRADDVIARLGLDERVDELPSRFSRGLRQKTALAIGFIRPSSVLLIDEPFVGLDNSGRAGLIELIDEHHAAGDTVLVATHDLEIVERVSRCIALRNGRVVHDGPATPGDIGQLAG